MKRADIQGLRSLAVILVIFSHLPNIAKFPGGFVGVDIFFVISGYVITRLLISRNKGGTSFWKIFPIFIWKRIQRLVPALFVMIATVLAISFVFAIPAEYKSISRAGLWSEGFLSNFFFLKNFDTYWNPELLRNPFLHTWSLGVEFQIYLFLPIFLWAIYKFGAKSTKAINQAIALSLIATLLSFAIFCAYLFAVIPSFGLDSLGIAFYSPFTRIWEFGIGALATLLTNKKTFAVRNKFFDYFGWILLVSGIFISQFIGSISLALIPVVIGTAIILFQGETQPSNFSKYFLRNQSMVWLGDRSYSLYLWHWPALMVALWVMPGNIWVPFTALIASVLLANLSFKFIETQKWSKTKSQSKTGVGRFSIIFGITATLALTIILSRLATSAWYLDPYQMSYKFPESQVSSEAVLNAMDGCEIAELEMHCNFFPPSTAQIVVIGDSLSYRSFPAVALAAKQNGYNASQLWTGGCSIEANSCPEFIYDFLSSHEIAGLIVTTNYDRESSLINGAEVLEGKSPLCDSNKPTRDCEIHKLATDEYKISAAQGLEDLLTYSSNILVALPFPQQAVSPSSCFGPPIFTRKVSGPKECGATTLEWQIERQGLYPESMKEVVEANNQAVIWNPTDFFCYQNYCPAFINEGEQIMDDSIHWNWEASRFIYPPIEKFVAELKD